MAATKDGAVDEDKSGKDAEDANTSPLIIGHRPILKKDPVVTANSAVIELDPPPGNTPEEAAQPEVKPTKELKLDVPKDLEDSNQADKVAVRVETAAKKPEPDMPAKTEDKKPEEPEPAEIKDNKNEVPASESPEAAANAAKEITDKQAQAETAQNEAYQKLLDQKKYFVPIDEKKRQRSILTWSLTLVVVIVLIALLVDLMIDAGIIKTSVKPPISIFNTK
jgi:hypothetical protein